MIFAYYAAMLGFLGICLLLCTVILAQESKGTGLGASFGGDVGSSVFGTATADVLKKFTAWMAAIFFVSCLLLSLWTSATGRAEVRNVPQIEERM